MRINKFIARATGMSRRAADATIAEGRVTINGTLTGFGTEVTQNDTVTLDGKSISLSNKTTTIMLNKPAGYVVSRDGQGSKTIYDLLPAQLHRLKAVGRLDKNSSGLLLLTNDGTLANELTHPKQQKTKIYEVQLNKPLTPKDWEHITKLGVKLEDGLSKFKLNWLDRNNGLKWLVTMHEGRNRQIRRTFAILGYTVTRLHRTHFGNYNIGSLGSGKWEEAS